MTFIPHLFDVLAKGDYYLDPGSGSFLIQILLAALLGSAYAIKVYWRKIKSIFKKGGTDPENVEKTEEHSDDAS